MTTDAGGIVGEFLSLKESTDADVLAMQCGDFYEFFADDAELVADELDLKVSQKSSHGSSYPMAGVPLSELTPYLTALVERGYRVAVAEQYETDDGHAREIERVVSPGTVVDPDGAEARYLAAVERDPDVDGDDEWGVAFAEVTTGRFHAAAVADLDDVRAELHRFAPVELLPGPGVRDDDDRLSELRESTDARLTLHESEAFAPGRARHRLGDHFGTQALEAVGLNAESAVAAAGAVLHYVDETGAGVLASMTRLGGLDPGGRVALDATTQRNLELVETMQGESTGTLLSTLDHTETAAGTRLLREWLTRPQRDRAELERRGAAVEAFARAALARDRLLDALDGTADLERLAARATSGSAGPRDLAAVRSALGRLPALASAIDGTGLADSPIPDVLARPDQAAARDLHDDLSEALAAEPPGSIGGDGGVIARGYDDELDELVAEYDEAAEWLDTLAEREKRRHSLSHVSVDRNKTDGYYIQVGKSVAGQVPDHYREVKTLKNSKRFVTEELEERERTVLRMEERREELERRIFEDVRKRVAAAAELLQDVGRAFAELDVLAALGHHAATNDWARPEFTGDDELRIEAGRHPVVEQTTDFVPNDLRMDHERGFLIVTGPNMSGKSTYMRQCALISLLAQIGSFVPADSAVLPLVDGVYTRVGALDELAQGRSTFMVEMQELSNILHSATEDSLVILDEVGRGTATYDGISIAWAATEYLHNEVRAKTLFATHYHELTALAEHLPRVANVHVAAEERDGDVTFLRRVREGATDRSYGVHVAELAGVPDPVVGRADEVLDRLREEKAIEARGSGGGERDTKQAVFDLSAGEFAAAAGGGGSDATGPEPGDGTARGPTEGTANATNDTLIESAAEDGAGTVMDTETEAVLEALRGTDVNETPPVELMATVQEWQRRLESGDD
ncbi:DNA mismatch repair protein MutS [Halobaculum halobium]|uniref:DNA mismatch repair protein MutS n=1 Tax=Halobaculum halobium TaxID=3032281 RepID=A0ABD5TDU3_9EURY|nr:DNA mismatch repair protein MutS [Halobaculum sp. SYNS20]